MSFAVGILSLETVLALRFALALFTQPIQRRTHTFGITTAEIIATTRRKRRPIGH